MVAGAGEAGAASAASAASAKTFLQSPPCGVIALVVPSRLPSMPPGEALQPSALMDRDNFDLVVSGTVQHAEGPEPVAMPLVAAAQAGSTRPRAQAQC